MHIKSTSKSEIKHILMADLLSSALLESTGFENASERKLLRIYSEVKPLTVLWGLTLGEYAEGLQPRLVWIGP